MGQPNCANGPRNCKTQQKANFVAAPFLMQNEISGPTENAFVRSQIFSLPCYWCSLCPQAQFLRRFGRPPYLSIGKRDFHPVILVTRVFGAFDDTDPPLVYISRSALYLSRSDLNLTTILDPHLIPIFVVAVWFTGAWW